MGGCGFALEKFKPPFRLNDVLPPVERVKEVYIRAEVIDFEL
jgi:hypothetical protein